jgi:hypothetical protein
MRNVIVFTAALVAAACGGAPDPAPPDPAEAVTVHVVNRTGEAISVDYTFARMEPFYLGSVPRGGEADFTFAWEPGPLEFVVDLPRGLLTSNRMSARRGDRLLLEVTQRRAQASHPEGSD